MTVPFATAQINRRCVSIEKNSICFKQAVYRIWKLCQSYEESAFSDNLGTEINVEIDEIVKYMNDKTDSFPKNDGASDHLTAFDSCNGTQNEILMKACLHALSAD